MSDTLFYKGFWTDWERGKVFGQTLTLSSQNGSLLIAFLALFVRLTGGHIWNIARFVTHQLRSKSSAQPALYHQQQAVLRNIPGSTDGLWQFILLSWAWRSKVTAGLWRSIPLASLAIFHIAALTVAGLFSSRVATVGGDTLIIAGDNCGIVQFPSKNGNFTSSDAVQWGAALVERKQGFQDSLTYTAQCYNSSISLLGCNTYTRQMIDSTVDYNAPCPFDSQMCKVNESGAISIDSGAIETRRDLGINTPGGQRLTLRTRLSCAPLSTDNFHTDWAPPDQQTPIAADKWKYYFYGPALDSQGQIAKNYTYAPTQSSLNTAREAYTLQIAQAYAGGSSLNTFIPISPLARDDADVFLVEMTNVAQYESPVFDPFFNATLSFENSFFSSKVLYSPVDPFAWMGCAQQWQICNPNEPASTGCTALGGHEALRSQFSDNENLLSLNEPQKALLYRLLNGTMTQNSFSGALNDLGPRVLLASDQIEGNALQSTALPSDQWIREVQHLFNVQLTNLQRRTVEYATGPKDTNVFSYVERPATDAERQLCSAQLVRGRSATSFSVFGVCVILIGGALLILLDYLLPWIVFGLYRTLGKSRVRCVEWQLGNTLQWQRMAFEGSDQGVWTGREDQVPVTLNRERLALLASFADGWELPPDKDRESASSHFLGC